MPSEFDPYYTWLGIPPEEQPPHHYRLLGIRPLETNRDVITHAMDQRMVYLRSMQAGKHSEESQRLLNEVSAAAIVLLDEEKKAAYDERLHPRLADAAAGSRLTESRPAELQQAPPEAAPRSQPPAGSTRQPLEEPESAPTPRDYLPIITGVAGVVAILVIVLAVVVVRSLTDDGGIAQNDPAAATGERTNLVPAPNPPAASAAPSAAEPKGETAPPMPPPASAAGPSATSGDSSATAPVNPTPTNPAPSNPAPTPPAPANPPPEPSPAATNPATAPSGAASSNATEPSDNESALPPADAIQSAQARLAELFGDDVRQAVKPEQKLQLAQRFIQFARETQNDRAAKYALLDAARKLLLAAGEVDLALTTIDSLVELFLLDRWELRTEAFMALSDAQLPSDHREKLGAALVSSIDEAVRDEEFARAEECARLAVKVTGRSGDMNLRRAAMQKRSELTRLKEHFHDVELARGKLEENPDDPPANLTVGKFLCFVLADFDQGVPHLTKGGQERFAAPASADLAAASAPDAALQAGDAWYDLAESLKTTDKEFVPGSLYRARFWYERALSSLQGLDKARVEKRLQEIGGPSPPQTEGKTKAKGKGKKGKKRKPKANPAPMGSSAAAKPGLIGRLAVNTMVTVPCCRMEPIGFPAAAIAIHFAAPER